MKTNDIVAVYGSLRKGLGNHRLLSTSESLGTHVVNIPFKMVSLGGFPALVPQDDSHEITVELYTSDDPDVYSSLDMLEGYPSFYNRKKIAVDGKPAWVYFIESHEYVRGRDVVESGDWSNFVAGRYL